MEIQYSSLGFSFISSSKNEKNNNEIMKENNDLFLSKHIKRVINI